MITELLAADFDRARPVFGPELAYNLIIDAVLDGSSPGRVWVDDPAAPRSAFLWGAEGWYLGGAADNAAFNRALNALIFGDIKAAVQAAGQDYFFIGYEGADWAAQETVILAGAPSILRNSRRHYVCRTLAP